ncbi:MAG: hypothetical protein CM15mP102_13340 [Flavobacteriales bacterium]|nr:MAG: hypothetical protein CM15mP102_13340 [Flavobacteriales bacterium]
MRMEYCTIYWKRISWVWGDFDVTIKIDEEYIVAASGYLQEAILKSQTW